MTKIKATSGGSTTWTRKNSHWVTQPMVGFIALEDHTSTEDENGIAEVSSAKARPTGMRMTARIGNMRGGAGAVSSNQYGASASQPPSTAPAARATRLRRES